MKTEEEPKKTETRWLWASKDGEISTTFSCEPLTYARSFVFGVNTLEDYEALPKYSITDEIFDIKLEWSATEFDVC